MEKMSKQNAPRPIDLVRSDYQPTKAEMEEEIVLEENEGRTPQDLIRQLVQPVKINFIPKPRK